MQLLSPPRVLERVGFVVPRWTAPHEDGQQGIPFRSLCVAGALYNAGYELVYFDQDLDLDHADRRDAFDAALRSGVRVVFIWMNDLDPMFQTVNTWRHAQEIKARHPHVRIVAGGEFLTLCPTDLLPREGPIDTYIRGYGEEACPAYMAAIRGEKRFEDVSGLYAGEHVNPVVPHQRFHPEFLDLYRVLDLTAYQQMGGIFGNAYSTFLINTGRGCAKRCSFCYWRNHAPSLVSPEAIVDLVAWLERHYGVRQFHLAELDFFTNRKRPLALARLWKKRVPNCRWFALVSVVDALRFSDEEWDLLAEGGMAKIELGSESGSAAMLRHLGKRHAVDAPVRVTEKALARGVETMHNFIFGLVDETRRDRRESLRLIDRLHRLDPERVFFTFRFFQPTWATPMGDEAIARMTGFPRSLEELVPFRNTFGDPGAHTFTWMNARDDRLIKQLVYYYLPMVTSKLAFESRPRRYLYRALRKTAKLRLRHQWFGAGIDRWLYRQTLGGRLSNTYTP